MVSPLTSTDESSECWICRFNQHSLVPVRRQAILVNLYWNDDHRITRPGTSPIGDKSIASGCGKRAKAEFKSMPQQMQVSVLTAPESETLYSAFERERQADNRLELLFSTLPFLKPAHAAYKNFEDALPDAGIIRNEVSFGFAQPIINACRGIPERSSQSHYY